MNHTIKDFLHSKISEVLGSSVYIVAFTESIVGYFNNISGAEVRSWLLFVPAFGYAIFKFLDMYEDYYHNKKKQ